MSAPPMLDRLRVALLGALPQHALSRAVLAVTRVRTPAIRPVIRWFARRYAADLGEAAKPDPRAYPTFNAFFVRALRDGARPLAGDADTLVSPVDGRVSATGAIERDRLFQAKGLDYSLERLLGGDRDAAAALDGGRFATLYLAPGDYHRVHMPLAGTLQRMTYVPGRLYSVAPWTVGTLDNLFTRNERVAALFDTRAGPLGIVLVGAINVAAIETTWTGLVTPPRGRAIRQWQYARDAVALARGQEMGRFNMGSTVIVLAAPGVELDAAPRPGERVRVGEALGRVAAGKAAGATAGPRVRDAS